MKRWMFGIALVLTLVIAAPATAQYAVGLHTIPVVAKVAGSAGTDWMSDLSIANVSTVAVAVRAGFFREATNNTFPANLPIMVTLQPGETVTVSDVLGTWFPAEGNTKGALILIGEPASGGGEDEVLLAVTSRTYNNADPNATYGQTVVSSFFGMVFGQGIAVLPGVRHDARFRSNIGVVNMAGQPAQVQVTTFDTGGTEVAQVTRTVESLSLRQWSLGDLGITRNLSGGRTEVRIDPATITWDPCGTFPVFGFSPGVFIAYLSKVDQATGDAEFSLGQVDWTQFVTDCGEPPPAGEDCCPCP
jgi:hypothetical protein